MRTVAIGRVFNSREYTQLKAKWGKQWGKHLLHLLTFCCFCLLLTNRVKA